MNKTKWNTATIEVPNEFNYETKNGNVKGAKPITKTNNIATRNKTKAIKIITNNDIDHIKIINQGEKIDKVKIKKPRAKKIKPVTVIKEVKKHEYPVYNNPKLINAPEIKQSKIAKIDKIDNKTKKTKTKSNEEKIYNYVKRNIYTELRQRKMLSKEDNNEIKEVYEKIINKILDD